MVLLLPRNSPGDGHSRDLAATEDAHQPASQNWTRINLQAKTLDINNLDDINSSGWENVEVTSYGHDRIYFTASHVKMPMSIEKKNWPYTKDMKMVIFQRPQVSWQF